MMRVVVVGSGASGVHFALSALRRGHEVVMVDVGHAASTLDERGESFTDLKTRLPDPVRFFLGERYEAVVHPGLEGEYYGFPPNKSYVFTAPAGVAARADGFAPLLSFAQGGLAQAWTGGVYPLNDAELAEFPIRYADLAPHYEEVARRIGITGVEDDLARFFPVHAHLSPPVRLDAHSERLLRDYERQRARMGSELRSWMGRSRVAVLTEDRPGRGACTYLGRCLWGCPRQALYTPSVTLAECQREPRFTYLAGLRVTHLVADRRGRLTHAAARSTDTGAPREIPADRFVLAAGTLSSAAIYVRSVLELTGELVTLPGLMDNRQILVPFVHPALMGRRYQADSYQYHQLALGIEGDPPAGYVHGQITTLKGALVHPIVHQVPFDLRAALSVFRRVRTGLGVVNLNLHDTRRPDNGVTLEPDDHGAPGRLAIRYAPPAGEAERIALAVRTTRRVLSRLGCVVPPGMTHVRPMGASVHYAGTLPMAGGDPRSPHRTEADGRSVQFEHLWVVDGSTMPFLPAKNLTFTLMANAVRIAAQAF